MVVHDNWAKELESARPGFIGFGEIARLEAGERPESVSGIRAGGGWRGSAWKAGRGSASFYVLGVKL
jgi:hypothetical protein